MKAFNWRKSLESHLIHGLTLQKRYNIHYRPLHYHSIDLIYEINTNIWHKSNCVKLFYRQFRVTFRGLFYDPVVRVLTGGQLRRSDQHLGELTCRTRYVCSNFQES